jgi:hypothetical protein
LFAAPNAQTSEVITRFHQRHRSAQFREFLDLIEAQVLRRDLVFPAVSQDAGRRAEGEAGVFDVNRTACAAADFVARAIAARLFDSRSVEKCSQKMVTKKAP